MAVWHYLSKFSKRFIKKEVPKKNLKFGLLVKSTKISGVWNSQILQFLEKSNPLVHIDCSSSKAWFLNIMYQNFHKGLSKNEVSKNFKK